MSTTVAIARVLLIALLLLTPMRQAAATVAWLSDDIASEIDHAMPSVSDSGQSSNGLDAKDTLDGSGDSDEAVFDNSICVLIARTRPESLSILRVVPQCAPGQTTPPPQR